MKTDDEKERNERIDKLIDLLSRMGVKADIKDLETCLSDEHWFNKDQTEEDYQKEQAAWLAKVAQKKKPAR